MQFVGVNSPHLAPLPSSLCCSLFGGHFVQTELREKLQLLTCMWSKAAAEAYYIIPVVIVHMPTTLLYELHMGP